MLPDLEQSGPRVRDPVKEKKVREAAEKAIKEIRTYGFEVTAPHGRAERSLSILASFLFSIICPKQAEVGAVEGTTVITLKVRRSCRLQVHVCVGAVPQTLSPPVYRRPNWRRFMLAQIPHPLLREHLQVVGCSLCYQLRWCAL